MSMLQIEIFKSSQSLPVKLLEQSNKFYFGNVQVKTTRGLFKIPPFKIEMELNKQWSYYDVYGYFTDWRAPKRVALFAGDVII